VEFTGNLQRLNEAPGWVNFKPAEVGQFNPGVDTISEIGGNQAEKSTENDYGVGATGFGPSKYKRLSCQN
ncbi:hypothetical protein, partial [Thermoactinomyces sp. CICC 10522]|uniref:hypothetical protein n=1 Tax=Thermoactinomyces sp. CICC 10522 TaxID=2767427 RepID=UPI001E5A9682